ncbi:MAG: CinA family protein [Candidatus Shapirobacteria bacterium]|nr:CinA family protein [Candidatus Shapirobacteria bacterium]
MADNVVKKLTEEGLLITIVESCTGGGVANAITNIPGASEVFKQGFVPYSNEAKIRLGVRKEILEKFGVYSLEMAEELANVGILQDRICEEKIVSIGVTGNLSSPFEIFVAVKFKKDIRLEKITLTNNTRQKNKEKIISRVLEMVLEVIIC